MPIKKNPVSLLQEISVRRRYIMRDTLLEEHGEGHEKKFEILLVLDGSPGCLTGTATASSKSEAKKLAAVDILKKVIKLDDLKLKENEKEEIVNVLLSEDDSRELECPVDYIADLERKVTLKGLPTPIYNLVSQGGPPHQRTFVIQCVAGQKKAAKRDAAGKMLKKIEDASEKLTGVADKCKTQPDLATSEVENTSLPLCQSPASSKEATESGPENIKDVTTREVQSPKSASEAVDNDPNSRTPPDFIASELEDTSLPLCESPEPAKVPTKSEYEVVENVKICDGQLPPNSVSKVADNNPDNPISQLEREVLIIGLPKPEYTVAEDLSHKMMFTMKCEIGEIFSTLGCASRKKEAKRIAAQAMLDELKSSRSLFSSSNGAESMSVSLEPNPTVSSMIDPCTTDELVSKVEQIEISCEETGSNVPSSEANRIAVGSPHYMNKLKELGDKLSELAESCD
ncbi:uncharacterized protein LOC136039350 isoform X2 [Artemia franciscana]|uniref:uncharacterized protein LOC136039350 isoform X2 n=1 Tax=Artemia franciscana TaxID=6661 RepID=UPI0032DA9E51